jgi:Ca2+-binding RTX toxin-like protein
MATYNLSNGLVTNASDNVVGTDNNDTFEITEGSDFYNGLAASDTLNAISYAHNNVGFDMASGVFTADGDASKSLINFENYLAGFLFGSSDVSHTITGTAGTNIITGGNKNDRIYLSGGNDTLNGGGGSNTLDASKLSSSVNINLASNTINTGDTISNFQNFVGTSSNDIILGSDNANTLEGGEGNDTYFAGGGNDRVVDTAGNDLIVGGDGSDSASIGDAVITDYATGEILGAQANFLVFTRSDGSTATIYDSTESITANGQTKSWVEWFGDYRQSLGQGTTPDVPVTPDTEGTQLIGSNKKKDKLIGGANNDYLDGRKLKDKLTGGDGSDDFAFSKLEYGKPLRDKITDFSEAEGDRILVKGSKLGFGDASQITLSVATNADELTTALGSSAGLVYNQSNGDLYANLNGASAGFGNGGVFANIGAGHTLTTAEFGLI